MSSTYGENLKLSIFGQSHGAAIGMTLDGIPYIGRFSTQTPEWYVATGFGKWGMTTSMAAATLLCDLITGKTAEEAPIFSPQRWQQPSATAQMMKEGTQAVKGLTRRVFKAPEMDLSALPVGHGGVVEWKGEKVGVYKDGEGKVHAVSVKCPHLGCQVEWNPDEKSWDCPCHGSRFDYQGNLIDNPAQEDPCVKTG